VSGCQLDGAARADRLLGAPAVQPTAGASDSRSANALVLAIEQVYPDLLRAVEIQVRQAGLAHGHAAIREAAAEVIAEATARALPRVDRWEPDRGTRPWVAAFAANVIKEQRRAARLERTRRVPSQQAATAGNAGDHATGGLDPLDTLVDLASLTRDRMIELAELVSPSEWELLRLAHVDELTGVEIAARLGVSEGAARTRLSRAKDRFRAAFRLAESGEQGGRR
jgi:RNA polymerase sigma factor (sigma-70 family)